MPDTDRRLVIGSNSRLLDRSVNVLLPARNAARPGADESGRSLPEPWRRNIDRRPLAAGQLTSGVVGAKQATSRSRGRPVVWRKAQVRGSAAEASLTR